MSYFLEEIPEGIEVFIDANIFVYFFSKESFYNHSCKELFKRVEKREIKCFTNVIVIQEALHRIMIEEAIVKFPNIRLKKITHFLKNNPEIVKQLKIYNYLLYFVEYLNIEVLPINFDLIKKSQEIKKEYGLLNNDALLVQTMFEHDIMHLVTNDKDFERIPVIHVYKPSS